MRINSNFAQTLMGMVERMFQASTQPAALPATAGGPALSPFGRDGFEMARRNWMQGLSGATQLAPGGRPDIPTKDPVTDPQPQPPTTDNPTTPISDPQPQPPQSKRKVFVFGNKKHPRTLGSFLKKAQKYGINIDPSKFTPEQLKMKIPAGKSIVVSDGGEILGMKDTRDVMGDDNLGVRGHLRGRGDLDDTHTVSRQGYETVGRGGDVEVNGQNYEVDNTFLKSPVALDLNHDGKIGTTGASTAQKRADGKVGKTVMFDVDGDGKKDRTEWMSGNGDGLLVDDRDGGATRAMKGNGEIDGRRLYGDQGGKYANGYDKMAQRDSNHDGKLSGQELEGLKVWVDDGDALIGKGELKSLKELGITEMSVGMHTEQNARGEDLMRSSFVQNGQQQMSEDVWFATH
ncbi:MAG: hypothetical protein HY904_02740 [Deltaproteobacteria bacterium]|nr:hypothetical protein [Deltaproteobacteria bacterium]